MIDALVVFLIFVAAICLMVSLVAFLYEREMKRGDRDRAEMQRHLAGRFPL